MGFAPERKKSLRLHQASIGDLLAEPEMVIGKTRKDITRRLPKQRTDGMTAQHLRDCESILDAGVDRTLEVLSSTDEASSELQENSPFAGVLWQERRAKILRTLSSQRQFCAA